MKHFIFFTLLTNLLFSYSIEHFLMPKDGSRAQESMIKDILSANKEVDVAMFMITNKKLVKALKERAKKGNVHINVIADKSFDIDHFKESRVKKLLDTKNIFVYHLRGKKKKKKKFGILHSKLVVIDDKIVYLGSANWTKSAFKYNYEILVKIVDGVTAKLYKYYFEEMMQNACYLKGKSSEGYRAQRK